MSCECHVTLYSNRLNAIHAWYDAEDYQMPCSTTVAFLRQLDSASNNANKFSQHRVNYNIRDGKHTYSSERTESPAKAAAKIELFMKDPNLLPKLN